MLVDNKFIYISLPRCASTSFMVSCIKSNIQINYADKKLNELEDWVSNKLKKPFKLEKLNSSKHIECNLKLTNNFIKKYNEIYDAYDFKKEIKTLL